MIAAAIFRVERKLPFRHLAHQKPIAYLQLVEQWRQRALGNKLEEKLNFVFRGRRCDGIRSLDALALMLDSERGKLSRDEVELAAAADAEHPQIGREVGALRNLRLGEESLVGNRHNANLSPAKGPEKATRGPATGHIARDFSAYLYRC